MSSSGRTRLKNKKRHAKIHEIIEFTNDENEVVELLKEAESIVAQTERELNLRRAERLLVRDKLKAIRGHATELSVTDHAIVRYLERMQGIDVEAIKKEMIGLVPEGYAKDESGQYVDIIDVGDDGLSFVIRDNLIITVRPSDEKMLTI